MALSGDTALVPGLRFDASVYVNNFGQISTEQTNNRINGVIQVIDGHIKDVLHLIGHQIRSVEHLMNNGILRSTGKVNECIKELPQRGPASHLIQENDTIFGLIIDLKGETRIAGIVRYVIPEEQLDGYYKAVKVSDENTWNFCDPQVLDMSSLISGGAILGIIGIDGFFFLQTTLSHVNQLPDLVLILQNGYFIIEKSKLVWTRLKTCRRIGEIESNVTELEIGECIASSCGGCIRDSDGFHLYGSGSAIVEFEKLKEFAHSMQTIGFETLSQNEETNIEELENVFKRSSLNEGSNIEELTTNGNQLVDEESEELSQTFSDFFSNTFETIRDSDAGVLWNTDEEYFDEDYDY